MSEKEKIKDYYSKWVNVEEIFLPICEKLGYFPSTDQIRDNIFEVKDCVKYLYQYHGKIDEIAKKMGYPTKTQYNTYYGLKKSPLSIFENAKKMFDELVKDNDNNIPKRDDLPSSLLSAINRYHGKYEKFLIKCGYTLKKKKRGYWNNIENIKNILIPICEKFGCFPPISYLKKENSSLVSAIYSYHGGIDKVAKILGYKRNTMYEADDGHYVSSYYEFVVDNILSSYDVPHSTQPIIIKNNRKRGDFKVENIYIEVAGFSKNNKNERSRKYHENLNEKLKLYKDNKLECIVIYEEDFDDFKNVKNKLDPLIIKFGDPNAKIDIENVIRPVSWWSKWENIENLLKNIIDNLGYFPTAKELESTGNSCISHYIVKYHGGVTNVKRKLGIKIIREKPKFFSKWENVEEIFLPICKKLGYFPSAKQIRNRIYGVVDCVTGLYKYHGGINKIAEKLGYPTKEQYQILFSIQINDKKWNQWNHMYNLLKKFRKKHPKRWPKSTEEYEGVKLGRWCSKQRHAYKNKKLDATRIDLLNKAGFVWDPNELVWGTNFELYKKLKKEFNREPKSNEEYEGVRLGGWCHHQRQAYKKDKLDAHKIDLLNQAGFVWELR